MQETLPVLQRVNAKSKYCHQLTSLLQDVASTLQDLLQLEPARLKHAEEGFEAGFRSPTLQCLLQGWQSGKVRWAVKSVFAVDAEHFFVCGNRFLLFNREQYDIPNFEVEMNEMGPSDFLLYINFASRVDLFLNESYFSTYYCSPLVDGQSISSFISTTMADKDSGIKQFFSASPWIRLHHAATGILVTLPKTDAGFEKLRSLVGSSLSLYKALLELPQAQVKQDEQQQQQLKARDDFLLKLQEKDTHNAIAEQALGKEAFAKVQQITSCDPAAVVLTAPVQHI